jgi:branched-chain amino acid transport system permease protein
MKPSSLWKRRGSVLALVAFFFLLPVFIQNPYWMHVFIVTWIYIIVTASLRFTINMGEWSFAHVPLMGMGGYASALLAMKLGLSFWVTLPLAALITAFISILVYLPCLPTTGTFFFFASYAFGEVMRLCWARFKNPFGGPAGLLFIPAPGSIRVPGLPVIEFGPLSKIPYYYTAFAFMLISLVVLYRLEQSRLGRIAEAIKESNLLAQFVGIRVGVHKMIILVIGSAFAAVGGSLYAHYTTLIMPVDFYWGLGIYIIIYAVVGGTRRFAGPIIGVILFVLLRELLRPIVAYVPLVYGLVLAATLVFLPEGLISLPEKISGWTTRKKMAAEQETNDRTSFQADS